MHNHEYSYNKTRIAYSELKGSNINTVENVKLEEKRLMGGYVFRHMMVGENNNIAVSTKFLHIGSIVRL